MGNCQDVRHGGEGGDGYDYGEDRVEYAPEKSTSRGDSIDDVLLSHLADVQLVDLSRI